MSRVKGKQCDWLPCDAEKQYWSVQLQRALRCLLILDVYCLCRRRATMIKWVYWMLEKKQQGAGGLERVCEATMAKKRCS